MDERRIAGDLVKLAGSIMGPGIPDGTGPYAGAPECPVTEIDEEGIAIAPRRRRRYLRRGPQDGTGPRGGTPMCPLNEDVAIELVRLAKELVAKVKHKAIVSPFKGGRYSLAEVMEDGSINELTWEQFKRSPAPFKKQPSIESEFVRALARQEKQMQKQVDFNMWVKSKKPSFEEQVDWLLKNTSARITKKGIKASEERTAGTWAVPTNEKDVRTIAKYVQRMKAGKNPIEGKSVSDAFVDLLGNDNLFDDLGWLHDAYLIKCAEAVTKTVRTLAKQEFKDSKHSEAMAQLNRLLK